MAELTEFGQAVGGQREEARMPVLPCAAGNRVVPSSEIDFANRSRFLGKVVKFRFELVAFGPDEISRRRVLVRNISQEFKREEAGGHM